MGGWSFYIIKLDYFGKVLKCVELSGTSKKGKCIEFKGMKGVTYNTDGLIKKKHDILYKEYLYFIHT